jgi:hypothetical protein
MHESRPPRVRCRSSNNGSMNPTEVGRSLGEVFFEGWQGFVFSLSAVSAIATK